MVTGDNLQTARAIALECGILASNADATEPNLIEGKRFRALSEFEREEIAEKISVCCGDWIVKTIFSWDIALFCQSISTGHGKVIS